MRRVLAVAAFAFLLGLPSAWSQRGGGGFHGGGMGHAAAVSRGPGVSAHTGGTMAMHAGPTRGFHSGYRGCYNCGHGYPHRTYPYYHYPSYRYYVGFYGRYGYAYPYYAYGAYWPWWWDSSSYDNDSSVEDDVNARQMDELSQQVQQLREQLEASQYAEERYRSTAPEPSAAEPSQSTKQPGKDKDRFSTRPDLATVLVFRDQRIQQVKNYAIVGKTLVVIADQRQKKIPLADLDLDATTKLNEERGVDFQVPR